MPTLRDIAKLAGCNVSTVSKALRGSNDICAATVERINRIATEAGYEFSKIKPIAAEVREIGVVFPELDSQYYGDIYNAFRHIMREHGYFVSDILTDFSEEEEMRAVDYFLARGVSGILFLTENSFNLSHLRHLAEKSETKFVMVTLMDGVDFCDCISVNHNNGVIAGIDRLYEAGHRNIAFLGEEKTLIRKKAFVKAMKYHGLEVPDGYIIDDTPRFEDGGYRGMKKLLSLSPRPSAVFAAYDEMAFGAINAIKEAGLSVPDDISIIGVNNNAIDDYINPPLTSLDYLSYDVGKIAAEMMTARISGISEPFRKTLLCPCLRERKTIRNLHI